MIEREEEDGSSRGCPWRRRGRRRRPRGPWVRRRARRARQRGRRSGRPRRRGARPRRGRGRRTGRRRSRRRAPRRSRRRTSGTPAPTCPASPRPPPPPSRESRDGAPTRLPIDRLLCWPRGGAALFAAESPVSARAGWLLAVADCYRVDTAAVVRRSASVCWVRWMLVPDGRSGDWG